MTSFSPVGFVAVPERPWLACRTMRPTPHDAREPLHSKSSGWRHIILLASTNRAWSPRHASPHKVPCMVGPHLHLPLLSAKRDLRCGRQPHWGRCEHWCCWTQANNGNAPYGCPSTRCFLWYVARKEDWPRIPCQIPYIVNKMILNPQWTLQFQCDHDSSPWARRCC